MADVSTIGKKLKQKFPQAVTKVKTFRGELTISIDKDYIGRVARFLHSDKATDFDYLSDLCGVDKSRLDSSDTFEVVYHLYSLKQNHRVRLKVEIPASNPSIDTVTNVWKTADWHEREAYDMYGIIFEGHPNLERILTPEGFEGYPLRKDYPLKGRQPNSLREVYRKGEE
ncbi:MAG: NADH-quinone oxidoreductase subunit C [Candidatus Scalindua arabica]|uniref:NADH-quinone oxidoreductase subunit C n=1 Tax=Candidatus Scalindua arabica TaxID=1127984 RepID=A0A941W0Y8_9BACT|nr:NADH-quinone oxidoreductase subunit C [Candidatus Scalindua arabica]